MTPKGRRKMKQGETLGDPLNRPQTDQQQHSRRLTSSSIRAHANSASASNIRGRHPTSSQQPAISNPAPPGSGDYRPGPTPMGSASTSRSSSDRLPIREVNRSVSHSPATTPPRATTPENRFSSSSPPGFGDHQRSPHRSRLPPRAPANSGILSPPTLALALGSYEILAATGTEREDAALEGTTKLPAADLPTSEAKPLGSVPAPDTLNPAIQAFLPAVTPPRGIQASFSRVNQRPSGVQVPVSSSLGYIPQPAVSPPNRPAPSSSPLPPRPDRPRPFATPIQFPGGFARHAFTPAAGAGIQPSYLARATSIHDPTRPATQQPTAQPRSRETENKPFPGTNQSRTQTSHNAMQQYVAANYTQQQTLLYAKAQDGELRNTMVAMQEERIQSSSSKGKKRGKRGKQGKRRPQGAQAIPTLDHEGASDNAYTYTRERSLEGEEVKQARLRETESRVVSPSVSEPSSANSGHHTEYAGYMLLSPTAARHLQATLQGYDTKRIEEENQKLKRELANARNTMKALQQRTTNPDNRHKLDAVLSGVESQMRLVSDASSGVFHRPKGVSDKQRIPQLERDIAILRGRLNLRVEQNEQSSMALGNTIAAKTAFEMKITELQRVNAARDEEIQRLKVKILMLERALDVDGGTTAEEGDVCEDAEDMAEHHVWSDVD